MIYLVFNWAYYIVHPWELLVDLYGEIKAFCQRGWRGYADADIWSFDEYLTQILAGGLKELSKRVESYPDYQGVTFKGWGKLLKENAKRFQNVLDYEEIGHFKDKKKIYKERDKALEFVKKWFICLWY